MAFPQLLEEDMNFFDLVLRDVVKKSEAMLAMIVEKAGYLIHQYGSTEAVDTVTLATLGSNAFNATQFMAQLVNEHNFASMYQQGETYSTLILNIDEHLLLVLVFGTQQTVGSMKYYAAPVVKQIAEQLKVASARGHMGLDLCDMNPDDVQALFRRGAAAEA
jgi:predicted regulator of Ras-like GTPase activity (Roadblock/LC7/MglB family)